MAKFSKGTSAGTSASIRQRFIFFSVILLLVILAGGSFAFFMSMTAIIGNSKSVELSQEVAIERITLEASVNGEIAIALKMADSPLIKRYFQNPLDEDLAAIAMEEIAGYRRAFAANTVFWVNDQDHMFYQDDAYVFTLDVNDPGNYWYLMTLNETELYNFNINFNPDLNVTNLWINAPVFDDFGRPIGILGTGIDLTFFIDSIYASYHGDSDLYFFNDLGEITGAENTRYVIDKVTLGELFEDLGEFLLEEAAILGRDEIISFNFQNSEVALGRVPALDWYALTIQELGPADYLNTSMSFLFLGMMGLIIVIFIIFNISILGVIKPIVNMAGILNVISTDWDMTKRLDINRKDEIGNLAGFFNTTFERIRELIFEIRSKTRSLSDTGKDLASSMSETAAAIIEISNNIQNMKGQVIHQSEEVSSASEAIEGIMAGLDNLNGNINLQAESVAESSSAIEEMLANIHSVTETLIKNSESIASLDESSEAGRLDLQKVGEDIQEIARESEGLLEINSVMENIASQTNLLSMNAAIEAAHAGEAGRGFAVVAEEIRKLADNSSQQSKTISTVLKKITSSIDAIRKSTDVVLARFETITRDVSLVSSQGNQIRNAMEEQETGSRQILEAIGKLNDVTRDVKAESEGMSKQSMNVINQSASLKRISQDVSNGMDEMNQGAALINTAVNRVNNISSLNKESIESLGEEIAKFKVE